MVESQSIQRCLKYPKAYYNSQKMTNLNYQLILKIFLFSHIEDFNILGIQY